VNIERLVMAASFGSPKVSAQAEENSMRSSSGGRRAGDHKMVGWGEGDIIVNRASIN
jgi:hypothetical protein